MGFFFLMLVDFISELNRVVTEERKLSFTSNLKACG